MKRFLSTIVSLGFALASLVSLPAHAIGFEDGMPAQKPLDTDIDPNVGHWIDLEGGVTNRPYVTSFKVINGGVTKTIVSDNNTDRTIFYDQPAGKLVVAIEPYNLCTSSQDPTDPNDHCYATPNRISLTVGYSKGENQMGYNFSQPVKGDGTAQSLTDQSGDPITVNEDTVFDITLNLNTIGTQLRWAQMYGHPDYWAPSNLGLDNATIHLKMRPAVSDLVTGDMSDGSPKRSCWLVSPVAPTPDCPNDSPDETSLRANIVFSLEEGYGEDLTGAVFGVSHALQGEFCNGTYAPTSDGSNPYCEKTASPTNPVMEFQMIGFHYQKGHSGDNAFVNEGTLEAFLPAAMLMNTYGLLPDAAATAFTVSRASKGNWADSKGSFNTPVFDVWEAGTEGSDGVLLTIDGVTYSAPKFTVERSGKVLKLKAKVSGSNVAFSTTQSQCTKKKSCVVNLYELQSELYNPTLGDPVATTTVTKAAIKISAPAGTASGGDRFLLSITRTNGDLVNSTTYTIPGD